MEELIYLLKQLKFIWKPTKVFTSHWGRKKKKWGAKGQSPHVTLSYKTLHVLVLPLFTYCFALLNYFPKTPFFAPSQSSLLAFLKYIANGGLICCCSLWLECYSQRCPHKFLLQQLKISTLYLGFSIRCFLAHYLKLQFIPTKALCKYIQCPWFIFLPNNYKPLIYYI